MEGAPFVLSEKFSQDPLEETFARHRRSAGCNENMMYGVFKQQFVADNVIKSDLIRDVRRNARGHPDNPPPIDINDQRLSKAGGKHPCP